MFSRSSIRLEPDLLTAAETFFHADLCDVVIRRSTLAQEAGAAALAIGNEIHVAADCRLTTGGGLELLGHELTHVVQQRQGRVRGTASWNGFPANDDAELEREAVEMGRRFATGEPCAMPRLSLSAVVAPVMQRSVMVGNQQVRSEGDLSPTAATVLGLIEGGPAWLSWASSAATHYHYPDERKLIAGVQSGLHDEEPMLLPGLAVLLHPFKLMEMRLDDLRVLAAAESDPNADSVTQMQGKKVLAKYDLRTQPDLSIGSEFLTQTGVDSAPVFQAMRLTIWSRCSTWWAARPAKTA